MPKKLTYEFVKEQIEKEGYELLSKEYINANTKLKVKCNKGHEFNILWYNFNRGCRCSKCFGNKKISHDNVKKYVEEKGYKLLSKYKNSRTKLTIKYKDFPEFKITYTIFKKIKKHPIINKNDKNISNKLTYKFVKEQIEKEGYELLSEEYINTKEKLKVRCKENHEYEVNYNNFNTGYRCPICSRYSSKQEKEVAEYIKSLNMEIIENDRELIYPYELDVVIPDKKIAIEYCGLYWHSEYNIKNKNYHLNKLEKCNEVGYRLITIFEDEWIHKQEIVKSRLKYILGLNIEKLYARKCMIKEVSMEDAKKFIEKYHIQGYSNCKVKLGAFYNEELVAVMTFSNASRRGNKKEKNIYELNRFCSSTNVIGIASKLLKFFQRNYEYKKIITFADRRWSEGKLYEKIGFKKIYNVPLNYFYIRKYGNDRFHRFNFRKKILEKKLESFDPQLTEHENMLNNGWLRIYDCGNIKYEIRRKHGIDI